MTSAVVVDGREYSGRTLDRRASSLAGGLVAAGLREGDVVAALLRNGLPAIDLILACRLAGIYYCPLNWRLTPGEIDYILRDCAARLLLGEDDLVAGLNALPDPLQVVRAGPGYEAWLSACTPYAGPTVTPRAHMAYTSGTTGRPKGVIRAAPPLEEWPHQQRSIADIVQQTMGIEPGCRALMPAPLYHSAPSVFVQGALRRAELLVLLPRFDPEAVLAAIHRHGIGAVYLVPVMYIRLLALPAATRARYDLSSLRFVASTGAPCAPDVKRAMIEWLGPVIHETYASSETGMITAIGTAEALARPGSVGRPVGQASIRILTLDGQPCPVGQVGLIHVRQPAYPDFTYSNQPEERRAIERDGHVALGDMGYLDADGYLYVSDRASDMVISGGVNIYPAEIEHALLGLPGVIDCAVFGIPDDEFGERLHSVVQCDAHAPPSPEVLIAGLRGHLAGFKIPRSIDVVDSLPRDANGKLAKRHLRAPFWAASGRRI